MATFFLLEVDLNTFDQIAFRSALGDHELKKREIQLVFDLDPGGWSEDEVWAAGTVVGRNGTCKNKAHLSFNYVSGLEIEVITYLEGPSWHDDFVAPMSHYGIHCKTDDDFLDMYKQLGEIGNLVQQVHTLSHTNPYLLERGRKYEYAIFDTRHNNGSFTKIIRRIEGS